MARDLVEVRGKLGICIGYGPGRKGSPRAIVVFGNGKCRAVALEDLRWVELPEALKGALESVRSAAGKRRK